MDVFFVFLGAWPPAFAQAASFRIRSCCGVLMPRPPGCPLKCAGGPLLPCKRGGRGFLRSPRRHGRPAARRIASSIKYCKSCSYFCREQSRQSEGIAVAMARVVNAVIGKKNKTWCVILYLKRCLRITAPIPGAGNGIRPETALRPKKKTGFPKQKNVITLHRSLSSGCSAVRLAHHVRDVGVAGSNPVIPTLFLYIGM